MGVLKYQTCPQCGRELKRTRENFKTANARKWKHLSGGLIIKAQEGGKTNFGDFLNSDSGKNLISLGSQVYSGIKNSIKQSKYISKDNERILKGKQAIIDNIGDISELALSYIDYLRLTNPDVHYGTVDLLQIQLKLANNQRLKNKAKADLWELELLEKLNKTILSIQGSGDNVDIGKIASSISSMFSKKDNSNTSSTNFSQNKSGTINSDGSMNVGIGNLTYNWNTGKFGNNSTSPLYQF